MVLSFYINTYEATQWDILLFVVSNTDLLKTGKLKNVSTRPGLPYRGEVVIAFDTKTARGQIGPRPV